MVTLCKYLGCHDVLGQRDRASGVGSLTEYMYRLEGFDYSLPYYYMVTLKKREGIALFSRNIEGTPTPNAATRRASTKNSAPQAARYSSHFGRPRQRNSTSRRCTNAATNSEISPPRRLGERRFRKPSQIPQPNVAGRPEVEVAAESCPSRRGFYPQMPGGIRRSASGSICRRLAPWTGRGSGWGYTWRATTNRAACVILDAQIRIG